MGDRICSVSAREILGPHGFPTVEAQVITEKGHTGKGLVPWGMSVGKYESRKIYDGEARYRGFGVRQAVSNVNETIAPALIGMDVVCQNQVDAAMIELDGTEDKSRLGGNAILPVSMAVAKAAASSLGLPLYRYLGGFSARHLPVPMCNVVGGGKFYNPYLAFEDYLILAPGFASFAEAIEAISMTYFTLGDILKETEGEIGTYNGIYTPRKMNNREVFEAISKAIEKAGYEGRIFLALDVCADQFYNSKDDTYEVEGAHLTRGEFIEYLKGFRTKYPLVFIEDPLHEDDFEGLAKLTERITDTIICGDDVFASNIERIREGVRQKAANCLLLKIDQVGSVSEAYESAMCALGSSYSVTVSMRSRDTTETVIADLAVGTGAQIIKFGAPVLAERIEKINRLCYIEDELGDSAEFRGKSVLGTFMPDC